MNNFHDELGYWSPMSEKKHCVHEKFYEVMAFRPVGSLCSQG